MKRIIKFVLFFLVTVALICTIFLSEKEKIYGVGAVCGTILGIIIQYLIISFIDLFDNKNWKKAERRLRRAKEIKKDTLIRISFAYLFRISVNGKYILIKNARNSGKFQPVGGVYKFHKEEEVSLSQLFHIEYDDKIKIDAKSKSDYRLYVKDKFLRKFVKRFIEKIDVRENEKDVSREFYEEIIKDCGISAKKFGVLKYSFDCRFIDEVKYTSIYKCYELLIADIYNVILDEKQERLLQTLINNENIMFATESEINCLGVDTNNGKNEDIIANHSWKVLNSNIEKATYRFDNNIYNVDISKNK